MPKNTCCCNICGTPVPQNQKRCRSCVPELLCVDLEDNDDSTGTGEICGCDYETTSIAWDEDECAYIGSITCGDLSVDLRFELLDCGDIDSEETGTGTTTGCQFCLQSDCLGYVIECAGDVVDTGTSTSPGNVRKSGCKIIETEITGDCTGHFKHDKKGFGFISESWDNINATDCETIDYVISEGCSDVTLSVYPYPYLNPSAGETKQNRLCKDCDCVCECILITWEPGDCGPLYEKVCWGEAATGTGSSVSGTGWHAFLDCSEFMNTGSDRYQYVDIEMTRGEDGCCYWEVTISTGVFVLAAATPGTATVLGSDTITLKTSCPEATMNLDVELPDGELAILDIECGPCGDFTEGSVCCTDFETYAPVCFELIVDGECDAGTHGFWTMDYIPPNESSWSAANGHWEATFEFGGCEIDIVFFCPDVASDISAMEFWYQEDGGGYLTATILNSYCDPEDSSNSYIELDLDNGWADNCCPTVFASMRGFVRPGECVATGTTYP